MEAHTQKPSQAHRSRLPHPATAEPVSIERPIPARDAADFAGCSLAAFWRGVAAGRFPAPVYPTPRSPRWYPTELRTALEATRATPREAMTARRAAKLAAARAA